MKIILYGASGQIGAGALLECLDDDGVEQVLAVVRRPTGRSHPKLQELVLEDFTDYTGLEERLTGYDACIFALGISAAGMTEADYRRITVDFAVAAGEVLLERNPELRMVFISGSGTDPNGRQMWARVKGEAENALLAMSFKSAHMLRPAGIFPRKGIVSRTRSYRIMYAAMGWAYPIFKAVIPDMATTTDQLGRALIAIARDGHPKSILEGADINAVCD